MRASVEKLHNNMYRVLDDCGKQIASVSGRRAELVAGRIVELYNSGAVSDEWELTSVILGGNRAQ